MINENITIPKNTYLHEIISFQCKLELVDIGKEVDHAKAFGRIAFSCPSEQVRYFE